MNIFYVDSDPKTAAQYLPAKLLVKMQVESIQMLVSAALINNVAYSIMPLTKDQTHHHKGGYKNHPCTQWVAKSFSHFEWLCVHTKWLGYYHQARQVYQGKVNNPSYAQTQLNHLLTVKTVIKNHYTKFNHDSNIFEEPPKAFTEDSRVKYPELYRLPTIEAYRLYVSKKWYFTDEEYTAEYPRPTVW